MVFDLDPSGADFAEVRKTADVFRRILEDLALPAFLKTSGASGLHIFVPLKREATFDQVRAMAHVIAAMVIEDDPKTRTFEMTKAKRGGRILLDINRNAWAQNVAPAFAVRPKPGAPVSVPIAWEELGRKTLRANEWTIRTVFKHLDKTDDPWATFWTSAISAKKVMKNLEAHHAT
jgi:bifunctional non-homologous end joining protein LigD